MQVLALCLIDATRATDYTLSMNRIALRIISFVLIFGLCSDIARATQVFSAAAASSGVSDRSTSLFTPEALAEEPPISPHAKTLVDQAIGIRRRTFDLRLGKAIAAVVVGFHPTDSLRSAASRSHDNLTQPLARLMPRIEALIEKQIQSKKISPHQSALLTHLLTFPVSEMPPSLHHAVYANFTIDPGSGVLENSVLLIDVQANEIYLRRAEKNPLDADLYTLLLLAQAEILSDTQRSTDARAFHLQYAMLSAAFRAKSFATNTPEGQLLIKRMLAHRIERDMIGDRVVLPNLRRYPLQTLRKRYEAETDPYLRVDAAMWFGLRAALEQSSEADRDLAARIFLFDWNSARWDSALRAAAAPLREQLSFLADPEFIYRGLPSDRRALLLFRLGTETLLAEWRNSGHALLRFLGKHEALGTAVIEDIGVGTPDRSWWRALLQGGIPVGIAGAMLAITWASGWMGETKVIVALGISLAIAIFQLDFVAGHPDHPKRSDMITRGLVDAAITLTQFFFAFFLSDLIFIGIPLRDRSSAWVPAMVLGSLLGTLFRFPLHGIWNEIASERFQGAKLTRALSDTVVPGLSRPVQFKRTLYRNGFKVEQAALGNDMVYRLSDTNAGSSFITAPFDGFDPRDLTMTVHGRKEKILGFIDHEVGRGSAATLFPWSGRIRMTIRHRGKILTLTGVGDEWLVTSNGYPIHGLVNRAPWKFQHVSISGDGVSITSTLSLTDLISDEKLLTAFGHAHIALKYRLKKNQFETRVWITNQNTVKEGEMIFTIGFHPNLVVPQSERAHAEITLPADTLWMNRPDLVPLDQPPVSVDGNPHWDFRNGLIPNRTHYDAIFSGMDPYRDPQGYVKAVVERHLSGIRYVLRISKEFAALGLYNGDSNTIALEPQTSPADAFTLSESNDPTVRAASAVQTLAPNSRAWQARYFIDVSDMPVVHTDLANAAQVIRRALAIMRYAPWFDLSPLPLRTAAFNLHWESLYRIVALLDSDRSGTLQRFLKFEAGKPFNRHMAGMIEQLIRKSRKPSFRDALRNIAA